MSDLHLLAVVVGGFGAAFQACMVIALYKPGLNAAVILPVWLALGWFIWRGGNMAWVRAWGSMAVTTGIFAAPWLYMAYAPVTKKLPEGLSLAQALAWSFADGVAMAVLEITALFYLGLALLFSLLAGLQYYLAKRRSSRENKSQ